MPARQHGLWFWHLSCTLLCLGSSSAGGAAAMLLFCGKSHNCCAGCCRAAPQHQGGPQVAVCGCGAFAVPCRVCAAAAQVAEGPAIGSRLVGQLLHSGTPRHMWNLTEAEISLVSHLTPG